MHTSIPLPLVQGSKMNQDTRVSDTEIPPSRPDQVNAPPTAGLSETLMNKVQNQMQLFQNGTQDILKCVSEMQDQMRGVMNQKDQELQRTRQHIHHLEAELDACRTQIVKSIPTCGISDSSIQKEYCLLRDNFSNWIEGLPEINNFESVQWDNLPPKEYPEGAAAAQSEILTFIFFKCLWMNIFEVQIFGASRGEQALLGKLRRGIHLQEPKKDSDTINKWKSETLQAYMTCGLGREQVQRECSRVATTTCTFLSNFTFQKTCHLETQG